MAKKKSAPEIDHARRLVARIGKGDASALREAWGGGEKLSRLVSLECRRSNVAEHELLSWESEADDETAREQWADLWGPIQQHFDAVLAGFDVMAESDDELQRARGANLLLKSLDLLRAELGKELRKKIELQAIQREQGKVLRGGGRPTPLPWILACVEVQPTEEALFEALHKFELPIGENADFPDLDRVTVDATHVHVHRLGSDEPAQSWTRRRVVDVARERKILRRLLQ